jgi:hypothetical protein
MSKQIEDFINKAAPATPSAPSSPQPDTSAITKDDAVLKSAAQDLSASTPTSTSLTPIDTSSKPPTLQAKPDTSIASSNSVTIANKKIIQPLKREPRPGLNELLAAEEAKGIMQTGYNPASAIVSQPDAAASSTSNPTDNTPAHFTPSVQPGSTFAPAPAAPAPSQDQPISSDPNNIAL